MTDVSPSVRPRYSSSYLTRNVLLDNLGCQVSLSVDFPPVPPPTTRSTTSLSPYLLHLFTEEIEETEETEDIEDTEDIE